MAQWCHPAPRALSSPLLPPGALGRSQLGRVPAVCPEKAGAVEIPVGWGRRSTLMEQRHHRDHRMNRESGLGEGVGSKEKGDGVRL